MNYVDLILIVIVLLSILSGWNRGFIVGILELLLLIVGLVVTFLTYQSVGALLEKYIPALGVWTLPVAFLSIYIIIRLILGAIIHRIIVSFSDRAHQSFLNRLGGTVPGAVNGAIYATIIGALMLSMPFFEGLTRAARESLFASKMAEGVEWAGDKLSPVFDDAVKQTLNKLTVNPSSTERVDLHYTVTNAKVRLDLEAEMLALINEERAKHGLQPLQADPEMRGVARKHSADMFRRGYFAHVNPDGADPFDRMKREKVRYQTAGENLALAPTVTIAHVGLMNSPGHRANILNPAFGRVGIGILDGGMRGLMVTQNFRN